MATEAFIIDILRVIAITAFAGGTSFLGVYIAKRMRFTDQQVLTLTAFGAGILIAAAVFEMVIEAEKDFGISLTLMAFLAGPILFTIADMVAEKKGGGAGILLGIELDIIPESLAIRAAIGKTAFSNNPKKELAAVGLISVIPIFLGLAGLFLLNRYERYYSDNICTISRRDFLYAIL